MGGGIALLSEQKTQGRFINYVYSTNAGRQPKIWCTNRRIQKNAEFIFMLNIDSQNFIEDLIQNKDEYDILSHKKATSK
jgi:hypothetical protein